MFPSNFGEKYKKALVIGTWWWNDIVSALIPALYLQQEWIETDIAWVLSPWAIHTFDGWWEKPVNEIEGEIKRYLPKKNGQKEISFIDWFLPKIVHEAGIYIAHFYDFSLRFWTENLRQALKELIKQQWYDLIIAADVWWDILARPNKDLTVLSPMMDMTMGYICGNSDVDTYLMEFGLGTDGELRPEGIHEIINELQGNKMIVHESTIENNNPSVQLFKEAYKHISTIRTGYTWKMLLETLDAPNKTKDIQFIHGLTSYIGKQKWDNPFSVVLSAEYFGKTYLIDMKLLLSRRQETYFSYENCLEQVARIKHLQPQRKTEIDGLYLWSWDQWTTPENKWHCVQCVTPSTRFDQKQRKEMILKWQQELNNWNSDWMVILSDDMHYIINAERYEQQKLYDSLCLLTVGKL